MIQREYYMERIRPFIGNELIKVLTGIRRAGKSVMLELIKQELIRQGISTTSFVSFNFENMSLSHLCSAQALHDEIAVRAEAIVGKMYLFLDEIQEVDGWERCVNSLRIEYDCDIYITGSNARLLSGDLATYLAGRYVEFVIYPFSFYEFLLLYHEQVPEGTKEQAFREYIQVGGMPFLSHLSLDTPAVTQYLLDVYSSVVLKDVVQRNNIRDVDLLERVITYIMSNIGRPVSATSISNYFKNEYRKVSNETVLNYIRACEDAFLFQKVSRYDLVGKKLLSVNEKYYLADHGLREAVYGRNEKDLDQVLENIICMELIRRGYKIATGRIGEKEIDFVCEKQGEKLYVQVTYILATPETVAREFEVLEKIPDNYPKYVVSLDEFNMSRNGIKHRNIRDFLLMPEWN